LLKQKNLQNSQRKGVGLIRIKFVYFASGRGENENKYGLRRPEFDDIKLYPGY
jgi:hypothetical protein